MAEQTKKRPTLLKTLAKYGVAVVMFQAVQPVLVQIGESEEFLSFKDQVVQGVTQAKEKAPTMNDTKQFLKDNKGTFKKILIHELTGSRRD